MKTPQVFFTKIIFMCIVAIVVSLTSCAQENNSKTTAKNDQTATVEAPKMDIQSAIIAGNLDIVRQHIKAGSDLNTKEAMSGSTPLVTAITFNKLDIAKALIDAKADLSIKNNDGSTALHTAAFFGRVEMVQLLIDANADKTIKNNFGATAREIVLSDFAQLKPIYEMLILQLKPMGFTLDIATVKKAHPVIAMMLQ
ncbi:ankyrin repeats (many copies) [Kordia sp. SMS9]|uniref:ankyrin repeat domain-containing protein n=1 Tax=Kordia sp. SMS9 TaxID=2282170 RepID=UPI000E1063DF|nr:ankyrin repeat domain-containing protein [Kordia sp. SMS9]AXG71791.1 ankyrin repeats (many copies) [Kordia sp. SMS9]